MNSLISLQILSGKIANRLSESSTQLFPFQISPTFLKKNPNHSKGYCAPVCHTLCKTIGALVQCAVLFLLITQSCVAGANNNAEGQAVYSINLPQQSLAQSLSDFSEQASQMLLFSYEEVEPFSANPVVGRYTLQQALEIMLQGTGFSGSLTTKGVLMVSQKKSSEAQKQTEGIDKMNTKKNILASTIAFFVGSQVVVAQEAVSKDEVSWLLEEVVVTAQKREQNVMDVPMTIGVLADVELRSRGISNMEDLSLAVPELTVGVIAPGQSVYQLRGIGSAGDDALVGVYLDEVPVTGVGGQLQIDLRTTDIERVEVLHGPQGTLYGQGSAGGTVRFITKKPQFDAFTGEIGFTASSTEGGDPSQTVTGIVNMPVVDDTFALRAAATYESKGGWNDASDGRENINDSDLYNIRVKALWSPVEPLDILGMVIVHRNDAGFANQPATEERVTMIPGFAPSVDLPNEDNYNLYNLAITYDLDFANILSSSSYVEMENNGSFIQKFNTSDSILYFDHDLTSFSQEVRLVSTGDTRFKWSFGGIYTKTDFKRDLLVDGGSGSVIFFEDFLIATDVESESWAVFGDVNYQVFDRLLVGLGLRSFEEEKAIIGQKETFESIDPRFYIRYELAENAQIYASVADGFRSGGFNDPGLDFPETYDPESVRSYEIGAKISELLDGRLDAEVALFSSEYSDIQTAVSDGTLSYTANSSKAELSGIDWAFTMRATEHLSFKFAGNIIDTEVTDVPDGNALAKGDQLNFIPESNYTLSAIYDVFWSPNIPGYMRLDYNQQGVSRVTLRSLDALGKSDEVKLLNARIVANWSDFSFELYASNILDENGVSFPSIVGNEVRPRPRTIGFGVSRNF